MKSAETLYREAKAFLHRVEKFEEATVEKWSPSKEQEYYLAKYPPYRDARSFERRIRARETFEDEKRIYFADVPSQAVFEKAIEIRKTAERFNAYSFSNNEPMQEFIRVQYFPKV